MPAHLEEQVELLATVDLFAGLETRLLTELSAIATYSPLAKGEYVFFQGDPADAVFLLLEGQVKLALTNGRGEQITVEHVAPGQAFALLGAFKQTKYPVSAQAMTAGEIVQWDAAAYKALFEQYPELAVNSTRIMTDRSINFQSRILELSTEKVERRIAHALLRLAHQMGKKGRRGVVIDLNLTRQDIAELSGTTLFTASRTLSKWQSAGVVECSKERVLITDAHQLVDIAEDLPSKYKSLIS